MVMGVGMQGYVWVSYKLKWYPDKERALVCVPVPCKYTWGIHVRRDGVKYPL